MPPPIVLRRTVRYFSAKAEAGVTVRAKFFDRRSMDRIDSVDLQGKPDHNDDEASAMPRTCVQNGHIAPANIETPCGDGSPGRAPSIRMSPHG
jgi:hypothetical protein